MDETMQEPVLKDEVLMNLKEYPEEPEEKETMPLPEKSEVPPPEEEQEPEEPEKENGDTEPGTTRQSFLYSRDREKEQREQERTQKKTGLANAAAIADAVRYKRLMKATIVGTDRVHMADETIVICAVALPDPEFHADVPVKILIPFLQMFESNPLDMKTVDTRTEKGQYAYYRRQEQFLIKMVGLEIDCVLLETRNEPDLMIAVGSRKVALEKLRGMYFFGKRLIQDFSIIEATIISVAMNAIAVTVGGVDTVMQKYQVTKRYHPDLRIPQPKSSFHVGDKIEVFLEEAEDLSQGRVKLNLDRRPIEMKEFKKRCCLASPGTVTKGIITEIYREKDTDNIKVRLYLPAYDLVAKAMSVPSSSFGVTVKNGTEVIFTVLNAEETGYLFGYIKSIIS